MAKEEKRAMGNVIRRSNAEKENKLDPKLGKQSKVSNKPKESKLDVEKKNLTKTLNIGK
jgi:hypothetical protein